MIADKSVIVRDPLTGGNRHIFAGQPVPAELVDVYESGEGEPTEQTSVEGTETPESVPQSSGDTGPNSEAASPTFASDAAEEAANDAGLDASQIQGTGKDGAITVADVKSAAGTE